MSNTAHPSASQPTPDPIKEQSSVYSALVTLPRNKILIPSVEQIARVAIPDSVAGHDESRYERREMFAYIQRYLKEAILSLPYGQLDPGKGKNLAIYPVLAPTIAAGGGTVDPSQSFGEQYRWDTYFTNELLVRLGMEAIAQGQLENLCHVYKTERRIPNALRSGFLSHSQPPLDGASAMQMVQAGVPAGEWLHRTMDTLAEELYTEWWDRDTRKVNKRQNELTERYGKHLTRHSSFHYHPFVAGVEDGKDHNWVTIAYGEQYLPVQLNSIICLNLRLLAEYYQKYRHAPDTAQRYRELHLQMAEEIRSTFWVDSGPWRGFRNISIRDRDRGPIRYGDLAAELFPLFAGVANERQAYITINNLKEHYLCYCGLASTAVGLRAGGSIPVAPADMDFQWEENVWPPLMMIAFSALENYRDIPGAVALRNELARRWIVQQESSFARDGVFWEKAPRGPGVAEQPGFYGNLPGFGWTISSYFKALQIAQNAALG